MFGIKHFIWIIMCIMFTIVMDYIGVKRKMTLKEAGLIMSFICLLSESSKIMCNMIESSFGGMVLNPLALPFHLCSMMLFGVLYITFGKDGELWRFLFLLMGWNLPQFWFISVLSIMVDYYGLGHILSLVDVPELTLHHISGISLYC